MMPFEKVERRRSVGGGDEVEAISGDALHGPHYRRSCSPCPESETAAKCLGNGDCTEARQSYFVGQVLKLRPSGVAPITGAERSVMTESSPAWMSLKSCPWITTLLCPLSGASSRVQPWQEIPIQPEVSGLALPMKTVPLTAPEWSWPSMSVAPCAGLKWREIAVPPSRRHLRARRLRDKAVAPVSTSTVVNGDVELLQPEPDRRARQSSDACVAHLETCAEYGAIRKIAAYARLAGPSNEIPGATSSAPRAAENHRKRLGGARPDAPRRAVEPGPRG